ncbi:thiazole synthase [Methylacidiphilum caldifontis]|uniref:Thiazole synthase n=1 Tax=Methylacidiphilum caldifontis TaxID=2795386 RepID=A0A4Y8PCN4_9BACT|nr:thiazole synthase [Methylacidiphilum caldifontis]QSR87977.1 thiazole synthase [Methylacidiphilum caldifontis]TFE68737.1 thiazole synthase [Methylacidiphilum caldifontis]
MEGISTKEQLVIAGRSFQSRLLLGTGKFGSYLQMSQALEASGCQIVTVSLRRVEIGENKRKEDILSFIDTEKYLVVVNTSGAMDAEEAVRIAKIAAYGGLPKWIKLEIHPDPRYLLPDPVETLKATQLLVKDDFVVLPYINADPVIAKRLEEAGAAAVMPLGSPIGSMRGIETKAQIEIIIEQANVPVIVDAGIGKPSHAAMAMEMGADGVLINTAIAIANDPCKMAKAFKMAIEAGRMAFEFGTDEISRLAVPTSPIESFL